MYRASDFVKSLRTRDQAFVLLGSCIHPLYEDRVVNVSLDVRCNPSIVRLLFLFCRDLPVGYSLNFFPGSGVVQFPLL